METAKTSISKEFERVRTVTIDGEPYFVGKDVAVILGYAKPRNAITSHVDAKDKKDAPIHTLGGVQNMTVINESGLYSLIMSSKLPTAKKFKRWVTSEALPSIRKTGSCGIHRDSYMIDDPIERAKKWIEEEKGRREQIGEAKPRKGANDERGNESENEIQ